MTQFEYGLSTFEPWRRRCARKELPLGQSYGSLVTTVFACIAIWGVGVYSLFLAVEAGEPDLTGAFLALAAEGVVISVLILVKYNRSGIYIFEPFTITTLVMVLVYFVAPVFQFASGSTGRYGVDVVEYCMPATGLVILGYFTYFLGYEYSVRGDNGLGRERGPAFRPISPHLSERLVRWAYCIWTIAYILNIIYYINKGFDLVYIITGGLFEPESNELASEDGLLFLAYSKFLLLGSWLMIYAYGKTKMTKVATFVLTILCMFLGGGRSTLMIAILAPVVFLFARKKKSPKGASVLMALLGMVILFAFMQVARVGLRSGVGINMSNVTLVELLNPFYAEIDDFKSFYALLGVVPEKHEYLYGSQMIVYSLVLLVPRAIYPGKPEPAVHELVRLSLGNQAVENGNAYPAIGEYYVEFGVVGVVVCMWLLGVISRRLKNCYLRTDGKSLAMMAYSMIYPSFLSLVIRGYMPQNFSMLLFLLLPLGFFYLLQRADTNRKGRRACGGNRACFTEGCS